MAERRMEREHTETCSGTDEVPICSISVVAVVFVVVFVANG